jgi:hypothetical protein
MEVFLLLVLQNSQNVSLVISDYSFFDLVRLLDGLGECGLAIASEMVL